MNDYKAKPLLVWKRREVNQCAEGFNSLLVSGYLGKLSVVTMHYYAKDNSGAYELDFNKFKLDTKYFDSEQEAIDYAEDMTARLLKAFKLQPIEE